MSGASRARPNVSAVIKLSSLATKEFWEIPILFEDAHLLALDKPSRLLTSPDRYDPNRPNLMRLLHEGIRLGKPWAREHQIDYLANAHRLDFETSGVLLLAKSKPMLIAMANLFGSEKPVTTVVALVQGVPAEPLFTVDAKLAARPTQPGLMRVDPKRGKRARTDFAVRERFAGYTVLECRPLTSRPHQVRVHLLQSGLPVAGDAAYGGRPLLLSRLKPGFRLKGVKTERPLISSTALHAEQLAFQHPVTGAEVKIAAPWPKDLTVAVKYLRRYAAGS